MPTAVTEPLPSPEPRRILWTRAEVDALSSSGLFEQKKFELVEGELIDQMGKLPPHVRSLMLLMRWLTGIFGWGVVYPEAPINVGPKTIRQTSQSRTLLF